MTFITKIIPLILFTVAYAVQDECYGISPYALAVGSGFDATTMNLNLVNTPMESQYFINVPMERTPGDCWFNPFTGLTQRIWNEIGIPIPIPEYTNFTTFDFVSTADEFDETISEHYESSGFFGIGKKSHEWSEYLKIVLVAGASRITSQGQFSAFRIDATNRTASPGLVKAVSKLCQKWYAPDCWNDWVVIFSDPVNGFGTHYTVSSVQGGGWNYEKITTSFQLDFYGSASLVEEAKNDFLGLIKSSGCICGDARTADEWYTGSGSMQTSCYGGTQPELCSQDNQASWLQWLETIPNEPITLMYSNDGVSFPKFQPIWQLFDDQELASQYKSASEAYITWAGVESVLASYITIMDSLVDVIAVSSSTPNCSAFPCLNNCQMNNNMSLLTTVHKNAQMIYFQLNETVSFITNVLANRDVVGYDTAIVQPYTANWTMNVNYLTTGMYRNLTIVSCECAWSIPVDKNNNPCSNPTCCYEPSDYAYCGADRSWQATCSQISQAFNISTLPVQVNPIVVPMFLTLS